MWEHLKGKEIKLEKSKKGTYERVQSVKREGENDAIILSSQKLKK